MVDSDSVKFLATFERSFYKYKEHKIAIYGTGIIAKHIINYVLGYNFECVIDRNHTGESFMGLPVLSISDAVKNVNLIIIAATTKNAHIIFNRIKPYLNPEILVLDSRGLYYDTQGRCNNPYWNETSESLKRQIAAYDVISFDIFDTLIMRKILRPRDLFDLVERDLGGEIPFAKWRIESESCLNGVGTFDEIYDDMISKHGEFKKVLLSAKYRELYWEERLIVPREEVVNCFKYAKKLGKRLCLASDMYLPAAFLRKILVKFGVDQYEHLFISSEKKALKSDGTLYKKIKQIYPKEKILHIGDDAVADISMAKASASGISTYRVYSAYELLSESVCSHFINQVQTVHDSIFLGSIIAYLLNSPFAMHEGRGKFCFDKPGEIAAAVVGMAMSYIKYLIDVTSSDSHALVLFVSRDGYFLHQIWQRLYENGNKIPKGIYFYASRQAALYSCVRAENDIDVLLSDIPSWGKDYLLKQVLEKKFDVKFNEIPNELSCCDGIKLLGLKKIKAIVMNHYDEIIETCERNRERYLNYASPLNLNDKNLYMVDIFTKGSTVYALSKVLNRKIHLVSFGANFPNAYLGNGKYVHALFGDLSQHPLLSRIMIFLEMAFASRDGQLIGFSGDGSPQFQMGSEYSAKLLDGMQNALDNFLNFYPDENWVQHDISIKLVSSMCCLLYEEYSDITKALKDEFRFYDPYAKKSKLNILDNFREN